jgi:hypothetical protein
VAAAAEPASLGTVSAIGDSVMLGAKTQLESIDDWVVSVDAMVNRQFTAGIPLLRQAAATGPSRIVLQLGNNGPVSDAQFDTAMRAVVGVPKIIVLTIQLPDERYPHEATTNDVIRNGAARWGATVADWNLVTNGHAEYFGGDGVHLKPAGATAFATLVAAAL